MNSKTLNRVLEKLKATNSNWVKNTTEALGELTLIIEKSEVVSVCEELKHNHTFDMLADLCGSDKGPEEDPRFEINYHLLSTTNFSRIRLKAMLNEDSPIIQSVIGVWKTANWHERETYDLLGIRFEGHPDLRRILLPSDFDGHALRKDYPLRGYEPYSLT